MRLDGPKVRENCSSYNETKFIFYEKGEKTMKEPKCHETRVCFAKKNGKCTLLTKTGKKGTCNFCKPVRDITDGKFYPFNPAYGK
jgi:hypothetical protein